MRDREEIADALYLLRAGSNPDTFLRTLRAYVLQHIETTEQMAELLCDLSSVNPPAFVEALQTLAGRPLTKAPADDLLRKIIDSGDGDWKITKTVKAKSDTKSRKSSSDRKPAKRPQPSNRARAQRST